MGVVQLLVNISDADAFQPSGRAIVTARKLRLLHAGVRSMTGRHSPGPKAFLDAVVADPRGQPILTSV